jgi:hypothetical protein
MTSDSEERALCPASSMLAILAHINNDMIAIRGALDANPATRAATRGCDIRRYRAPGLDEEMSVFEAYVEVETQTAEIYCWSLDIASTAAGWKCQRRIGKRTKDGEMVENEFQDLTFQEFSVLVDNIPHLMREFVDSAKDFHF